MATKQTDEPEETLEEALARANAEAKAKKENSPFPCQYCGYLGPIDSETLASLDTMPITELKKLVQRVCAARWGEIAGLSNAAVAEAMKLRLAHVALTAEIKDALQAIDKWLDRHEGKATQRIEQKVQHLSNVSPDDLTNAELLIELRKLTEAGQLPLGVKMLEDGRLDVIDAEYEEVR